MKTYGVVEVYLHHSQPRHWMEVSGQLHAPIALHLRNSCLYCTSYISDEDAELYGNENRSQIKAILDVNSRNYRTLPEIVLLTA
jgi:hypothetical protein